MPRNRQTIPKEQRLDEMLDAAQELFLTHGYGGTTMANIAKRAGVTNNAVYWYFPSKDDALAQVQSRALRAAIEITEVESVAAEDPLDQLFTFLEAAPMRDTRTLHRYLHERAEFNEAVQSVLDEIHDQLRLRIEAAATRRHRNRRDLDVLVEACVAILEGTSATGSERHGAELVSFVIELAPPTATARKVANNRTPTRRTKRSVARASSAG